MKKLAALILCSFLAAISSQAVVLFQDDLNYASGCIETDGLWYAYSPTVPHQDALVANDLLILNQVNYDAVAAPSTNFVNSTGGTITYASFTINVSSLPTVDGGYFCVLQDSTSTNQVGRVFIDAKNTAAPGTYRLGISDFATSITTADTTNYPLDLATGITYQVVFSFDTDLTDPSGTGGGNLWINPSMNDLVNLDSVYATDSTTNASQLDINISQIGFSQYANQGVVAIGNVTVGTAPADFGAETIPQIPVMGVQPQGTTNYAGNNSTLYAVASGIDESYQWYSNGVESVDNGVTVVGSATNVLNLTNVQATAAYYVVVSDLAGSVTSAVAVVGVDTTPTPPFFTIQPQGGTNSLLSPVTLTGLASGTGPITYQWYFEQSGGNTFSQISGATSPSYTFTAGYNNSGAYYLQATGGDVGQPITDSATINVVVIPPPLMSIAALKSYITNTDQAITVNGGQIFNVQGVVTTIGDIYSSSTSEFFISDGTGSCLVYRGGISTTNTPPAGALVNVISPAQSYYGEIEMDPGSGAATNGVYILSTNNPLPAPFPLNLPLEATNNSAASNTYGFSISCSLVTMTNVYLYSSTAGAAVTGNFPTNSSKELYAFQQPYAAGESYEIVYVYDYTNAANLSNTNYFGKPIPSFCYELTGAQAVYAPTTPRLIPSRYADFVTTKLASFAAGVAVSNGVAQVTWPAVTGSTYSLYSSTNLLGPWTQTFGLSYYPSIGAYTDTNATAAKFYQIGTP